MNLQTGVVLTV